MSSNHNSLLETKHEINFSESDYSTYKDDYERITWSKFNPHQMLIIAKAYFIDRSYDQSIKILNMIEDKLNTKIFYQKLAFLFKSIYLIDNHQPFTKEKRNTLKNIIFKFEKQKKNIPGPKIMKHHQKTFQEYLNFLNSIPDEANFQVQFNREHFFESEEMFEKQLKPQGFPCYFIPIEWLDKMNSKRKAQQKKQIDKTNNLITFTYPGPITPFSLTNEIFELQSHENKQFSFLNRLLLPRQNYKVITKNHWNLFMEYFNKQISLPTVKRLYKHEKEQTVYRYRTVCEFEEGCPLAIQHQGEVKVFQFSNKTFLETEFYPKFKQIFGFGQLKYGCDDDSERVYKDQIAFQNKNTIQKCNGILKYEKLAEPRAMKQYPNKIYRFAHNFNLQTYKKSLTSNNGLTGLLNLGNSCYLNASLQCLSHTPELSKYLIETNLLDIINFDTKSGDISCALADIYRKLWITSDKKYIVPRAFKRIFGQHFQQFKEKTQEDAHQFLYYLLNSIHDEINEKAESKRKNSIINDTSNFDKVKDKFIDNYEQTNKSIITELMKGYLHSGIQCLQCKAFSHSFDLFLMLSLPLPDKEIKMLSIFYVGSEFMNAETRQYKVHMKNVDNFGKLFQILMRKDQANPDQNGKNYCLLALNKKTFKIESQFVSTTAIKESQSKITRKQSLEMEKMDIEKLISLSEDCFFYFYEIKKKQVLSSQLVLFQYKYNDNRIGFPRLIYVSSDHLKNPSEALKRKLAYQTLTQSGIEGYSEESILKNMINIEIIQAKKSKIYNTILKIQFRQKLNLKKSLFLEKTLNETKQTYNSLSDCLELQTQMETIQNYKCDKCNAKTTVEKKEEIIEMNTILIISLKRFKGNEKNKQKVIYPLIDFDISQWLGTRQSNIRNSAPNMNIYDLYAICLHKGSVDRGHYTAMCKNEIDKKWYLFDDDLVSVVEEENVITEEAYILFYRRKNSLSSM